MLVCPWGEDGAAALDTSSGLSFSSPSFPPASVVDSVGAGDTFNAAFFAALRSAAAPAKAVRVACEVAGAKVGRRGFAGLGEVYASAMRKEAG